MKIRNIIYIFFLLPQYALSQVDKAHSEISMSAGIMTNQAYDTRLTYQYYLNKSIGVGASFGYYKQWHANHIPQSELHHGEWDYWRLSEKDYKPQNIYLEPTLSINSPAIAQVGRWSFKLGVDLGVMFQLPYTLVSVKYINTATQASQQESLHTSNMQWCFWDIRPAIRIENKGIFVDFGYGLSDFDIYSSYRKIKIQEKTFNDFYPKKKLNNTFFLKVGGYF
jgi:hypothetical protein